MHKILGKELLNYLNLFHASDRIDEDKNIQSFKYSKT